MTAAAAITILTQPVNYVGAEGSMARFTAAAEGEGLTYTWFVKNPGAASFTESSIHKATYSAKLTAANSGRQLYCVISDPYGGSVTTDTVVMAVGTPLAITRQPLDYVGAEGTQARVTVKAEGEGLSYAWFVKNPGASSFTESSLHNATYSAKLTAANDGRQLYCVVSDAYGTTAVSDTVTMRIGTALAIISQPQDCVAALNATARVEVEAEGEGLTYTWFVKNPEAADFTESSVRKAAYTFRLTAENNGRLVYCVISDSTGHSVTTDTVSVRVDSPIIITGQPLDVVAAAGSSARLTVTAEGTGLTYAWFVKNPGASSFTESSLHSATYSFKLSAENSGRQVYCVVTDAGGNTLRTRTATASIG